MNKSKNERGNESTSERMERSNERTDKPTNEPTSQRTNDDVGPLMLVGGSNLRRTKGPFTQAIFVAQLDTIFVARKLQPAAISSRF